MMSNENFLNLLAIVFVIAFTQILSNYETTKQNKQLQIETKRLELLHAIKADLGVNIVTHVYEQYRALGGNSYASNLFRAYLEDKK